MTPVQQRRGEEKERRPPDWDENGLFETTNLNIKHLNLSSAQGMYSRHSKQENSLGSTMRSPYPQASPLYTESDVYGMGFTWNQLESLPWLTANY